MSSLNDRIQTDLQAAMRSGDNARKSTLRMLTAAVKNAEIEARKPLEDDAILAVIQKQAKQRRESITQFREGGRVDLAEKEEVELAILDTYLPSQATPEEIEVEARAIIAETGASGPRDIGKVMPPLTRKFAGRADGRAINEVVRRLLGA